MITIDGVHLTNELGLIIRPDSTDEMLPSTRDTSITIPGRHGQIAFKSWLQPRQFGVSVMIPPQASRADTQRIVRDMSARLLDQFGNPKEVTLVYDYESDKHYRAKFTGSIDLERILRAGSFEIPFTAYDPFAYSNIFSDEITWGSEVITFEYNYLLGREGLGGAQHIEAPTTLTVPVDGYAVKPIFEISGSATALTVSANGFSFALPAFTDETWTIDCERYLVYRNGVDAFADVALGEFVLLNGDNSVVIGGSGIDVDMRIKFRDKYM